MNYRYKFSVVSAVYNVENFVSETIDSLIAQDIGFENIQVILVNDGSADKSGEICDEYAAKYPDNIVVIHTENAGLSSARNLGLEKAEGKYINFLDADDMLTPETMSNVWNFFEEHYDEICDELWYIYTDEQNRRERLKISRGYSDEKIDSMMKTQLSEEMFRKKCKVVIDNSRDFEYTCVQIQEAIKKLEII